MLQSSMAWSTMEEEQLLQLWFVMMMSALSTAMTHHKISGPLYHHFLYCLAFFSCSLIAEIISSFSCRALLLASSSESFLLQGRQKQCGWCGICHTTFFVRMQHHTTLQACIRAIPHPQAHLPINCLGYHEL